jgi:mediator of RNA polymerase II transcription subunit 13
MINGLTTLTLTTPINHYDYTTNALFYYVFRKVIASGIWLAPGDSEEVAAALSQALRNRIERSLIIHSPKL